MKTFKRKKPHLLPGRYVLMRTSVKDHPRKKIYKLYQIERVSEYSVYLKGSAMYFNMKGRSLWVNASITLIPKKKEKEYFDKYNKREGLEHLAEIIQANQYNEKWFLNYIIDNKIASYT